MKNKEGNMIPKNWEVAPEIVRSSKMHASRSSVQSYDGTYRQMANDYENGQTDTANCFGLQNILHNHFRTRKKKSNKAVTS
jgi:hypothetical protein